MATWPAKINYATGDVLTAAQMNDIGGELNDLYNSYGKAAGKNAVINGGMDFWQRSTSSSSAGYTNADRWYCLSTGGTTTWARESTIVPSGSQYSMKITQASSAALVTINQTIETLNAVQFAGQNVIISNKVAASSSTSFYTQLYYSTSVDVGQTGSWTQITATSGGTGSSSTTASFTTVSGVYAVPSTAKSLLVVSGISSLGVGVSAYIGQVQLELGSSATPFSRAGGSIGGELALCQRYYYRSANDSTFARFGTGSTDGTSAAVFSIYLPTQMRVAPTAVEWSNLRTTDLTNDYGAPSTLTINTNANNRNIAVVTVTDTGYTGYRPMTLDANNNAGAYLAFTAEL